MGQRVLGEIKPASTVTAVVATNNLSGTEITRLPCEAIQFQALGSNTGSVYICDRASPTLTEHVFVEIPVPNASPVTRPAWTVGNPTGANPLNAAEYFILPAVSGDGVRITVLES